MFLKQYVRFDNVFPLCPIIIITITITILLLLLLILFPTAIRREFRDGQGPDNDGGLSPPCSFYTFVHWILCDP